MNTVNASTNFTGFQLHLGCSPHVIPPLVPAELPTNLHNAAITATKTIDRLQTDVPNAHDNLLHAKIQQSHHARDACSPNPNYQVNDMVMLSTTNGNKRKKGRMRTTKFFPHLDGPFCITDVHPEALTYTLDIHTM